MKVKYGERIICEADHVCGFFRNEVKDGSEIKPNDVSFLAATSAESGYICEQCRGAVAKMQGSRWEVRTDRGWIS